MGSVALLREAPVADLAEPVDENRPGHGVARLSLSNPAWTRQDSSMLGCHSRINS